MPCYHPITAWQPHSGGPLQFYQAKDCNTLELSCGQCWGCRMKRSRDWAIRCMHEKQMHKHSCAITLTYDDKHLPSPWYSLDYSDWQRFMRKLRKALARGKTELLHVSNHRRPSIRFYMAGEYGPERSRPHWHAALFGLDFADKVYYKKTPAGSKIYTSPTLDKLWRKGWASIGELNFESAAYIARYIMKKRTGDKTRDTHIIDLDTGELYIRKKEFNNMSRRPGIGSDWLNKYLLDAYPHGKVIIKGNQVPTPRYYDKRFKRVDEIAFEDLQYSRFLEQQAQLQHHSDERLAVQEEVAIARTRTLQRNLD